jgi:hypothetical protein
MVDFLWNNSFTSYGDEMWIHGQINITFIACTRLVHFVQRMHTNGNVFYLYSNPLLQKSYLL